MADIGESGQIDICSQQTFIATPDIAGIGVTVSSILQSAIAVFGGLALYLFYQYGQYSQRRAKEAEAIQSRGVPPHEEASEVPPRKPSAEPSDKPSFAVRQVRILVFSLVGFQKAQCFFVMAVEVAALILISKTKNASSYIDAATTVPISSAGVVSVTLTLYALMRFGKSSWYIFIFSVCSWAFSLAEAISPAFNFTNYNWDEIHDPGALGSESCGLVSTTALCAGRGTNNLPGGLALNFEIFWLVLEHIYITALFGWAFAIEFTDFGGLFKEHAIAINDWVFGQIVGVTFWLPNIVEFVYLQIRGRMEGASYKLVWPLRITAEPDNKTTYGDTNPT
ncbi:MAG: hypothetical protein FRX48_02039 [Lasallia pustulata]|uniref:Uncharacterized protein n=1 Tax=Lasallia pustulata TaxID=136370 RepID=A0A5M8PY70_9LECA|nr:MAG: hypothetical protein FRX48_02039 [Lasallia pustulata]